MIIVEVFVLLTFFRMEEELETSQLDSERLK